MRLKGVRLHQAHLPEGKMVPPGVENHEVHEKDKNATARTIPSSPPSAASFLRAFFRSLSSFLMVSSRPASSSKPSSWSLCYSLDGEWPGRQRKSRKRTIHSRFPISSRPSLRLTRYCKSLSFCRSCKDRRVETVYLHEATADTNLLRPCLCRNLLKFLSLLPSLLCDSFEFL